MTVNLTKEAAEHIKQSLSERGKGLGIRIAVKTSGCSGLAYVLEYVDDERSSTNHALFEEFGVRLYVENNALPYLDGTLVDFKTEGPKCWIGVKKPQCERCLWLWRKFYYLAVFYTLT